MATVPRSIDALPLELMQQISSLLQKQDLLKLRLIAPRTVLPFINALVFENLIIDIDGTDDLPRWFEAEADGVAIKRLQEVAASRISDHVRVLTLRLTRPYSLSGYYEKLGVKAYPNGYGHSTRPKATLSERISSFFKPREETPPKVADIPPPQPRKRVDYAAELASALQALFKATDLVRTVRLIQPEGFNSEYDIVYPSVYARVLVRLINALQDVNIPDGASLELLDCPITHLEEAGLTIDEELVDVVASRFSRLALRTRAMGYAVIKPNTNPNLKNRPYDGRKATGGHNLGSQLIKGLSRNTLHIESLKIGCGYRDKSVLTPFIEPKREWPLLRHLELRRFAVDGQLFSDFTNTLIVQVETMILVDGMLIAGDTMRWRFIYDNWISIKESTPRDQWTLKTLHLASLVNSQNHSDVIQADTTAVIQKLAPPALKKMRKLPEEWPILTWDR